ncbi:MAG: SDR family NAD(P)-dependent oxidoreductase [Tissierellales bacterium]
MSKQALVIGAAGGVGNAVVRVLLDKGCRVTGTVLNDVEAATVKKTTPGVEALLKVDLSDADAVYTALSSIDTLDLVVVCAAISPYGPLETSTLDNFRRTLEINTVAALAIYKATMPALRTTQGRFLFISSFAGKVGLPFIGEYVASKHALEGLCDVMRYEAKTFGVDVILVEPGSIKTAMVSDQLESLASDRERLSAAEAKLYGDMYDNFARLAGQGWETMMEPIVVAEVVVNALFAEKPQARYQVGDDATYLCDVARKSDEEIEAVVNQFWAS